MKNTRGHNLKIVSSTLPTRSTKELFQSPSRQNSKQFATIKMLSTRHLSRFQEETGQALYGMDMSVKGVAYQAHYHQSQVKGKIEMKDLMKGSGEFSRRCLGDIRFSF